MRSHGCEAIPIGRGVPRGRATSSGRMPSQGGGQIGWWRARWGGAAWAAGWAR